MSSQKGASAAAGEAGPLHLLVRPPSIVPPLSILRFRHLGILSDLGLELLIATLALWG